MNTNDIKTLLVKSSGLVVFVKGILLIPKAIDSLIMFIILTIYQPIKNEMLGELISGTASIQATDAFTKLLSFFMFFIIARWLMKVPKCLKKWLSITETKIEIEQNS